MKVRYLYTTLFLLFLFAALDACKRPPSPWSAFTTCGGNNCIDEALAVNQALLKDPESMLGEFTETYQKGEDHVVGWLYLMRDSVLFNSAYGDTELRFGLQQAILNAVLPYEKDGRLGEMASSVLEEIGNLAISSELEDDMGEIFPVTGTYTYEIKEAQASGELQAAYSGTNAIDFELIIIGPSPAHNQGTMKGKAKLVGPNSYEYATNEFGATCRLVFSFSGDSASVVTAEGDPSACGFGAGIMADHMYSRTGFDHPFLSRVEAKRAKELEGNWVSQTDPSVELQIGKGYFTTLVSGEIQDQNPYQYGAECPAECNPLSQDACISILGQDILCYTIVKLDKKTLEVSLIGGAGNTLQYKRK